MQQREDIKIIAGINEDINPLDMKATGFYNGRNITILDDSGSEFGNCVNVKGNKLLLTIPDIPANATLGTPEIISPKIIGLKVVRDKIIIFTTTNEEESPTASYGQIWVVDYLTNGLAIITVANNLKYNGLLNFSLYNRITSIEVDYIDNNYVTCYWVDGYNLLRGANLMESGLNTYSPDKFDLVPNSNLITPVIDSINDSSGVFTAGAVQYAYKLINKSIITSFSPLSTYASLYESDYPPTCSGNIIGSQSGESTGKSVTVSIDIGTNTFFKEIEVYRIFFTDYNQEPLIDIVYKGGISTSGVMFEDTNATSLGSISLQEFNAVNDLLFVPKWITSSDNRLFASNVKNKYFDIDYDARSFGFKTSSTESKYYEYIGDATPITINATYNNFDDKADLVNSDTDVYKYARSSTTLGGTGLNVNYNFVNNEFNLDAEVSNAHRTCTWTGNDNINPHESMVYKGYQRGETYRFGIVFIDEKENSSFVKYIADIKFPSVVENKITDNSTSGLLKGRTLGIHFYIKNIPTNPVTGNPYKYKIVRVERKELDKTIIDQGLVYPVNTFSGVNYVDANKYASSGNHKRFWFYSPNTSFFQLSKKVDYSTAALSIVSRVQSVSQFIHNSSDPADAYFTDKCYADNYKFYSYNYAYIPNSLSSTIDEAEYIASSNTAYINGELYKNQPYVTSGAPIDYGGSSTAILTTTDIALPLNYAHVANIVKPNSLQYGGQSYVIKTLNEYIEASSVVTPTTSSFAVDSYGGDMFISLFQFLHTISSFRDASSYGEMRTRVVALESPINIELESEVSALKYYSYFGGQQMTRASYQEKAGTYQYIDGTSYTQPYDLYVYNSTYSLDRKLKSYTPKPYNFTDIANDIIIKYSEKNIPLDINDNWKKWKTNNYQTVNSSQGGITSIHNWNNNILFLQPKGMGICKVNERITYQGVNDVSTVLGTGDILSKPQYKSLINGSIHGNSVIVTNNSVMYYDNEARGIMMYQVAYTGASNANLSKTTGINKTIRNNFTKEIIGKDKLLNHLPYYTFPTPGSNKNLHVGVNAIALNDEIYYSFFDIGINSSSSGIDVEYQIEDTVGFSNILKAYMSYYDFSSPIYESVYGNLLSVHPTNLGSLWIHSADANRGEFYGTFYNSSITYLANGKSPLDKLYTNIEYNTDAVDTNGVDLRTDTFNKVSIWNEHQSTGEFDLIYNKNIKRRMRKWHITIPRAEKLTSTDRNDSRIRSKYIYAKFSFLNNANKKISLDTMSFKFNVSEDNYGKI